MSLFQEHKLCYQVQFCSIWKVTPSCRVFRIVQLLHRFRILMKSILERDWDLYSLIFYVFFIMCCAKIFRVVLYLMWPAVSSTDKKLIQRNCFLECQLMNHILLGLKENSYSKFLLSFIFCHSFAYINLAVRRILDRRDKQTSNMICSPVLCFIVVFKTMV